jgi:hypothetical protein
VFVDLGLERGDGLLKTFQGERFGGRLSVGRTPRGREGIAAIVGGAEITALMIRARIAVAVEVLSGLVALILRVRITALVIGTRSREAVGAEVPSVGAGSKAVALRTGHKCCLIGVRHKDISRAAKNKKRFGKRSDKGGGLRRRRRCRGWKQLLNLVEVETESPCWIRAEREALSACS